jgi:hypothetical protein
MFIIELLILFLFLSFMLELFILLLKTILKLRDDAIEFSDSVVIGGLMRSRGSTDVLNAATTTLPAKLF